MKTEKIRRRSYERVRARYGYVFISLWLVGFTLLFAIPFITSVVYSFNTVQIKTGEIDLSFAGWNNYREMFHGYGNFTRAFVETLTFVLPETLLVCVFSMFIAILLNQKFFGRTLARAVFFLPVIIASGVVMNIINNDTYLNMIMNGARASSMFEATSTQDLLMEAGINPLLVNTIMDTVNRLFYLVWHSGIQILIFLAGLQSIPVSLYEVSKVEGANAWLSFWKITLPMLAPMTLVNLMYTLIDNFISDTNPMFSLIDTVIKDTRYDMASAMAITNFVVIFILIGLIYVIGNRRIYYAVD